MRVNLRKIPAAFLAALVLPAAFAFADVCEVPSRAYPTVQWAIDSPACTTINLAEQSYPESLLIRRSLSILGPAPDSLADVQGFVEVRGSGNVVAMDNLRVENGCTPSAFLVSEGGQVNSERLEVQWVSGGVCPPLVPTPVFSDGFETGNTSAWSVTVP